MAALQKSNVLTFKNIRAGSKAKASAALGRTDQIERLEAMVRHLVRCAVAEHLKETIYWRVIGNCFGSTKPFSQQVEDKYFIQLEAVSDEYARCNYELTMTFKFCGVVKQVLKAANASTRLLVRLNTSSGASEVTLWNSCDVAEFYDAEYFVPHYWTADDVSSLIDEISKHTLFIALQS